ncbi:NCL2 [Symbiodinium microadriaticum]|nr:NCL2 [Symbiodinium microadriaticum]
MVRSMPYMAVTFGPKHDMAWHLNPRAWLQSRSSRCLGRTEIFNTMFDFIFPEPQGMQPQMLFWIFITYGYILFTAANMLSDGSELLLFIPQVAGLVGSVVLPVLGAVPDGMMVLFSGIGPTEVAQENVAVGVGALAGSTIMLLTVPWFLGVLGGRVDMEGGKCQYGEEKKLTKGGLMNTFFHTGIRYKPEIRANCKIMIFTALTYLIIQLPAWFIDTQKPALTAKAHDATCSQEKGYNATELFTQVDANNDGSIDSDEFTECFKHLASLPPKAPAQPRKSRATIATAAGVTLPEAPAAADDDDDDEDEEEESMPEEFKDLSVQEQRRQILLKSSYLMGLGTLLVLVFSDPMVDVLAEIGRQSGIPSFYISFVLAPMASNSSELVAAYNYASRKTSKTITIALNTLEGAACMNNTFCLGIFMALVYFQGLAWKFTAETITILVVEFAVAFLVLLSPHQRVFDAFIILCLFPGALALVYVLENYVGQTECLLYAGMASGPSLIWPMTRVALQAETKAGSRRHEESPAQAMPVSADRLITLLTQLTACMPFGVASPTNESVPAPRLAGFAVTGYLPSGESRQMVLDPPFPAADRFDFKCYLDNAMAEFDLLLQPELYAVLSELFEDGSEVTSHSHLSRVAVAEGQEKVFSISLSSMHSREVSQYTLRVNRRLGFSTELENLDLKTGRIQERFHQQTTNTVYHASQNFTEDFAHVECTKLDSGQNISCEIDAGETFGASNPSDADLLLFPERYTPALEKSFGMSVTSTDRVVGCTAPVDSWRQVTINISIASADRTQTKHLRLIIKRDGCKDGTFFHNGRCARHCPTFFYQQEFNRRCGACGSNCELCEHYAKCTRCQLDTRWRTYKLAEGNLIVKVSAAVWIAADSETDHKVREAIHLRYGEHWGEGAARCFSLEADILDEDHAVRLMPVPDSFVCPISAAIMVDPVATVDGSVYERNYIERWFREKRQEGNRITSPITGLELPSATLMPLVALQRAIEAYLAHRPELKREQMAGRSFEEAAQILQTDLFEKQAAHASTQDKLKRLKQANKALLRALHEAEERILHLESQCTGQTSSPFKVAAEASATAATRASKPAPPMRRPPGLAKDGAASSGDEGETLPDMPTASQGRVLVRWPGHSTLVLLGGVLLALLCVVAVVAMPRVSAPASQPLPLVLGAPGLSHEPQRQQTDVNPALAMQLEQLQGGSTEEKQKAVFMLRIFAAEHAENQAAVVHSGGLLPLVGLLQHDASGLREEAARALWNLARNNKEINAANQVAISRAGAIPPLVRLLDDDEQRIRVVAAAVLNDLAADNSENQVAIAQGGAIGPLVRILKRDEAPALVMAASLLKNLAASTAGDSQVTAALMSAVPPLVALLRADTLLAQEQASSTLGALAAHSRGIQAAIAREGAVPPLVERLHGDMMKGTAIVALRNLAAQHAENQASIAKAGAIVPLVKLLEDGMPAVREEAAQALWNLAQDNVENQLGIVRAGGSAPMVALLKGDTQEQATLTLLGLSDMAGTG